MQVDGVDGLKARTANPGPTAEFRPDRPCSELPGFASSSATSRVDSGEVTYRAQPQPESQDRLVPTSQGCDSAQRALSLAHLV